jgi:hypothetical protein
MHTTQATWHTDIFTTPLTLLFGAFILAWREAGRTSIVARGWSRCWRWRWRPVGVLTIPLTLKTLPFALKATTLLLKPLPFATIIVGRASIVWPGAVVGTSSIVSTVTVGPTRGLIAVIGIIRRIEIRAPLDHHDRWDRKE